MFLLVFFFLLPFDHRDLPYSLHSFPPDALPISATRELTNVARQGVRTARVVQERPDITLYTLRLPQATPALRSQVESMGGKAFEGKPFRPC